MNSHIRGLGLILALSFFSSACVTVYQPLSNLHRPVVVDTQVANFEGMNLTFHCIPKDFLNASGAKLLCRKVSTLFTNQGAKVHTITTVGADVLMDDEPAPPADLTIEIRARRLHDQKNPVLYVLHAVSFSLIPAIQEYTFVQEVEIRDDSNFLLVSDSMTGRFVRYMGAGAWVGNKVLDWTIREEEDKLTGDRAKEDFSKDFYGQLSQMVFNAKMRRQVLQESVSTAGRP